MIATTVFRRSLALLALTAAAATPGWGQQRGFDDRRYDDRQNDDRANAPSGAVTPDAVRAAQRPQRVADGALRATEVSPAGQGDRRAAAVPGNPVRDNGGQARGPAGERVANGQAGAVAKGQLQPAAPFQLSPQQQQFIDELLAAWEKHSVGITTFECKFLRWEYTPKLGPFDANGQLQAVAISEGEMKYIKPDKGLFHVTETRIYNKGTGKYDKAGDDVGEHWVCDGKVVWEVDAKFKQIKENPIPPEMQGAQIANGPLPFMLFGGEAAKLKARYYLREQTDPQYAKEEIWLESVPRWAADAANYRSAHLIMKRSDFLPYALRMYSPNGTDYTVYEFQKIRLNYVFSSDIKPPKVPSDWKIVRAQPQTAQQGPAAPPQR
ncbi:MAG: hypothetical protein WD875_16790 [Pirellulales bacterium]